MILNGAQILIECLKEQKVNTVFGFPGGAVLNIYDALYNSKDEIKHILTSHEQGASHAADGYARATGKVGVCIATSGPGATNLVTGIATAFMDSVPMVAITGQVPTSLLGKDSFQEVDITGITMPVTKHNYIVKDVNDLADIVREAFKIANEGRPGPVLIDICKDVTAAKVEYEKIEPKFTRNKYSLPDENDLRNFVNALRESKKPVILSGGGVSIAGANKELVKFADKYKIPVSTTLMGLGSFPGDHKFYMGLTGMHGSKTSNVAISESDLFIAIGARFSDRVISDVKKFAPNAKIAHIDIDPAEIGKNITIDIPLNGNIVDILEKTENLLDEKPYTSWNERIEELKEKHPLKYKKDDVLRPHYIIERLYSLTKGDAIITTEVGQNQLWAAQFYKYKEPRQFISSGGLGTMGYGLGACIGAQLGRPDKKVINVAGDGSFRMNLTEIATAVEYKIPIIIALLNNQVLGMVRQWQELFYDKRYSSTTIERATDFVKLAEAFGAIGINVSSKDDVDKAIEKALSQTDTPVVINFEIDKDDKVFPIVPPGAAISDLIEE
ncbi:MAG: biosynthetic-type acetolactate synthase large subunit [Clostridiales bacterium]